MSLANSTRCIWPAGQRFDRAVLHAGHADALERRRRPRALGGVETAEETHPPHRAHGDEVAHIDGEGAVDLEKLRKIGDVARRGAVALDPPAERREQAGQSFQQGGFARAIGPADGERRARRDFALQMVDRGAAVIAQRQIDEADRPRRGGQAQWSAQ